MRVISPMSTRFYFCTAFILGLFGSSFAATSTSDPLSLVSTYTNPMDFSIADPFVLKDGDTYYMYGTTDDAVGPGFDCYRSTDLVQWTRAAKCYTPNRDSWGAHSFWAPEVVKKDDVFYLHYTSYSRNESRRNICIAKSDSPTGPFVDYAGPLFDNLSVIDSHIYHDPKTDGYFIYAVPENHSPSGILGAKFSPDFKKLLTTPTLCLKGEFGWEDLWIEGPIIQEHKGTLYMIYSGSAFWEADYALGYATALDPLGPWTKSPSNPILKRNAHVEGPGHNGLALSPDGSELFCIYHAHAADWTTRRVAAMDRVRFVPTESGPDLLTIPGGPSWEAQPLPSGAKPRLRAASDEFDKPSLDWQQWHVLANYEEQWKLANGTLQITAHDGDYWRTHDSGHNIFLQEMPVGDFAVETSVTMAADFTNEQAFLALWQDEDNYVTLAAANVGGPRFAITQEEKSKPNTRLAVNSIGWPLCLRMEKVGDKITFFAGKDGKNWQSLGEPADVRNMRLKSVGLGAWSPDVERQTRASFDWFRVEPLAQ